ncbi:MAG: sigma factor G inhibitor Gin [Bacillota bacterium]|nr:sigma factor G inhibitor Gin [Bacillota bacterium]
METKKNSQAKETQIWEGQLLPRCSICGCVPEDGIAGGIRIRNTFICKSCEQRIVLIDIGSVEYEFLLGKIKSILETVGK